MTPEFKEKKLEKTDPGNEIARDQINYITGLIELNENAIRDAFVPEDTPDYDADVLMYSQVESCIYWVEKELLATSGSMTYQKTPSNIEEFEEPIIKLGLARFIAYNVNDNGTPEEEIQTYVLEPTEEAIQIADGLRQIQGYKTIAEQARIAGEKAN
ncbi:hypothetical protein KC946_00555 [Candidatus Saccharibacteria bacterium]|nr:hypothetical protein [Candidatus Saccharibacteria bacterium]